MRKSQDETDVVERPVMEDHFAALSAADREELEQLRAEREVRLEAQRLSNEAAVRAATTITLNLPPAAGKGIQMAGRMYEHGHSYPVTNEQKWALEEAERRCWSHEASLHESENKQRKPRQARI